MCLLLQRGGVVVYRVALWYPTLVSLLFSVCTPFGPPRKQYVPLQEQVTTVLPNFRYQLQFIEGKVEENVSSKEQMRQVLNAMYGGRGPQGEPGFTVRDGLIFKNLPLVRPTQLLNKKVCISRLRIPVKSESIQEMDYYVDQYSKNGIGPTR